MLLITRNVLAVILWGP